MATTNLNIRTEKAIKDQAESIFNELGINMTTAVNMFLRTAIREHGFLLNLSWMYPMILQRLQSKREENLWLIRRHLDIQAWKNLRRRLKYEI